MWFKNIHFYKFEDEFKLDAQKLHVVLATRKSRACGQMEMAAQGWTEPLGHNGQMLVHQTDGNLMLCLRREDKVLPASLVKEQVELQVMQIEQEAGRLVGRKERSDIKDSVLQELMPRALVKTSLTYAAILPKQGWFIVNAASAKKAEELIEYLRKTLGTFNVVLPSTDDSLEAAMTEWLVNDHSLPSAFTLEDACEMRSSNENQGVIRCAHVEIASDDVRAHVRNGYRVKKLAMNWQERLSFVLNEDLSIKRMRFDSAILDEAGEAGDDEVTRFDADFAIMAAELAEFIPQLLAVVKAKG
ncbi:recombination associated protein RdgC [Mariprofundus micogutta]|uniref:Recombination-associated protein RdgC n=1 Tax=Mariprofundus micogutta TaxID=1921010 RepID=A0A1L8CN10_9PROT|nr:recombination-associated protein RdgC [Mariprofundus micogutta]GAV20283.1 recombination associated protein RdgC [Mariprofundus micogutta]